MLSVTASPIPPPKKALADHQPKGPAVKPVETPQPQPAAQPEQPPETPAPVSQPTAVPDPAPVAPSPPTVTGVVPNCGDNEYANYIYMHESSCNTNATNWLGCYGIGQSCPASKIAYCGADYDCQNAWFTSYANSAYGGWYNAYVFWVNHHWW